MKPFWKSRLFWIGVFQLLAAITLYIGNTIDGTPRWTASEVILAVNGCLVIVLRWLTDSPVTSVFKSADVFRPRIKANNDAGKYEKLS